MGPSSLPASFDQDDAHVLDAPNGGRGRREMVDHTDRFARRLWQVTDGVWCMVGNGLSNQTFVEGPDGLIAIDTGESVEEMRAALTAGGSAAVREQADRALADDDLRWALQLATWLVRGASAEQADRDRLAEVPRKFGHRTTAANIRNRCLTPAAAGRTASCRSLARRGPT